jgi:triacylglycerol lipase
MGLTVHQARLPPLGSVPERAARLADFLRSLPAERVNVIAHSMGGLDARYAIAKLGAGDKIASLVTIGTPHRGTPLADLGQAGPALTARALIKRLGLSSESLDWLTPARMVTFNAEIADHPGVLYASVACRAGKGLWTRNPLLVASHAYIKQRAGTNDGVVPAWSQHWGRTLCEIQADHWAQIGWFTSYDARPVYSTIVKHLAGEGL